MSLVGNLEDLSLPDILQIVSLSRKSGILMLEREGQQGKIIIRQGKVIQTVSPRPGRTLGELLVARSLLSTDDLAKALEIQRAGGGRELLGGILVNLGSIDEPTLEKIVQEQIEDSIVYFLSWKEGTFSFELADIQGRGEFSVDPQAFILERGIDTQWLVLEGTRLIDERSRERVAPPPVETRAEAAGETSFANLDAEVGAVAAARARTVISVDDDAFFREMVRANLSSLGFRVLPCESVAEGLRVVEEEVGRGSVPAVVSDIVLPTVDGQGFLGGLELAELLQRAHPEVPVTVVTGYPDENVKAKILELGGKFLLKPGGADNPGVFFAHLAGLLGGETPTAPPLEAPRPATLAAPVAPPPSPVSRPATPPPAAAGREPQRAAPKPATATMVTVSAARERHEPAGGDPDLTPAEAALLRDMLEELQSPRATSEIGLLILRFAAELLNRAVLFVVKGGKAVGLGGFGVEVAGGTDRKGLRGISIPLDEPSLLEQAVRTRSPVQGTVGPTPWNQALLEHLGGKIPSEAVALPLITGGRVRVILYGDNLPETRPIGGTRALAIFLTRAGQTLEKVLLEKKLQETGARGASAGERREQHVGGGNR